jgi:hypothetical protein
MEEGGGVKTQLVVGAVLAIVGGFVGKILEIFFNGYVPKKY